MENNLTNLYRSLLISSSKENLVKYRRILLKISGESLGMTIEEELQHDIQELAMKKYAYSEEKAKLVVGQMEKGIIYERVKNICEPIKTLHKEGIQIGLVVGGGNLWRGKLNSKFDRTDADYIGMLATIMNGTAIKAILEELGCDVREMTALECNAVAEPFIKGRLLKHIDHNRITILAGGTGRPYCTTDSAAASNGVSMKAEVMIKLTTVNGVYTADPKKDKNAKRFMVVSYKDALTNPNINVMDNGAIVTCQENNLPILVVGTDNKYEDLFKCIDGKPAGTFVGNVEKSMTYEEAEQTLALKMD